MEQHNQNQTYSHPTSVINGGVVYQSTEDVPEGTPINTHFWVQSES